MKTDNLIVDLSFDFSLKIIQLYKILVEQKEYVLSNQLLRASTSIGANIEDAIAGQARRYFIFKMTIASKEAREARYWLLSKSRLVKLDYSRYLEQSKRSLKS